MMRSVPFLVLKVSFLEMELPFLDEELPFLEMETPFPEMERSISCYGSGSRVFSRKRAVPNNAER
jgi:hypothetical protein